MVIEFHPILCEHIGSSDKAIQVVVDGDTYWIPLSQIDDEDVPELGTQGVIHVAAWLVEQEGLPICEPTSSELYDNRVPIARDVPTKEAVRKVSHPTFGVGTVLSIAADKTVVRFTTGVRTILSRFLQSC